MFERVRSTAGAVAARARSVRIDPERLESLAVELGDAACEPPEWDPVHHYTGDPDTTLAFVISLDAVNFGSGWFPRLEKRPGCSGYHTIAVALKERFERSGAFGASECLRDCIQRRN